MIQVVMKSNLCKFDSCAEFANEFQIGEKDFILASRSTYEKHLQALNLPAKVVFRGDYGSGEPTDVMCDTIAADLQKVDCNRIIAIGGGAVIDIAKVLAVAGSQSVDELYDKAPDLEKKYKLVIVPTTCGTGSEVTNISIINRTRKGTKMGLVSPAMFADDAVLIPELLKGLPPDVFATSSIDALIHAVESALSPRATHFSKLMSYTAIEMLIRGYQKIKAEGPECRDSLLEEFLIASDYAGIAFGTAGTGTVHAMAYPLGGRYHVPHGESNYALFTGVMKKYMEYRSDGELAVMNAFLAGLLNCGISEVYEELEKLLSQVLPKKPLRAYGVKESDLQDFAESVIANQQRLLRNSFVPMTTEIVRDIYRSLY